jgi:hypothetical protein
MGKILSRLDRILTRLGNYDFVDLKTDRSLINSDHAAVIVALKHKTRATNKNEHVKLDNDVGKKKETLDELRAYLQTQLAEEYAQTLNPYVKLELAKMTIRTKAIDITANSRKKVTAELKDINKDIIKNTRLLTIYHDLQRQQILSEELNTLNSRRDNILQEQGEKLAFEARTRWYNEGEKSNKYFLNFLKRQNERNEMVSLIINGIESTDEVEIKNEVENYYQSLYNHQHISVISDNFFQHMFTINPDVNDAIDVPLTLTELWNSLKSLKATTPGPTGILNTYLKKLWDIMGPIILAAWNYSLLTNTLSPSHKSLLLRLIPKNGKDIKLLKNWLKLAYILLLLKLPT